jgi:hypothetical protein
MHQQAGLDQQYRDESYAKMATVAAAAGNRVLGVLLQQHKSSNNQ